MDVYTHELDKLEKVILQELVIYERQQQLLNEQIFKKFVDVLFKLARGGRRLLGKTPGLRFAIPKTSAIRLLYASADDAVMGKLRVIAAKGNYKSVEAMIEDLYKKVIVTSGITGGPTREITRALFQKVMGIETYFKNLKPKLQQIILSPTAFPGGIPGAKQELDELTTQLFREVNALSELTKGEIIPLEGILRRRFPPGQPLTPADVARRDALQVLVNVGKNNAQDIQIALKRFGKFDQNGNFIPHDKEVLFDFLEKIGGAKPTSDNVEAYAKLRELFTGVTPRLTQASRYIKNIPRASWEWAKKNKLKAFGIFSLSAQALFGAYVYNRIQYQDGRAAEVVEKNRKYWQGVINTVTFRDQIRAAEAVGQDPGVLLGIGQVLGQAAMLGPRVAFGLADILQDPAKAKEKQLDAEKAIVDGSFVQEFVDQGYRDFVVELTGGKEKNKNDQCEAIYSFIKKSHVNQDKGPLKTPEQRIDAAQKAFLSGIAQAHADLDDNQYILAVVEYQHQLVDALKGNGTGALSKTIKKIIAVPKRADEIDISLGGGPFQLGRGKMKNNLISSGMIGYLRNNLPPALINEEELNNLFGKDEKDISEYIKGLIPKIMNGAGLGRAESIKAGIFNPTTSQKVDLINDYTIFYKNQGLSEIAAKKKANDYYDSLIKAATEEDQKTKALRGIKIKLDRAYAGQGDKISNVLELFRNDLAIQILEKNAAKLRFKPKDKLTPDDKEKLNKLKQQKLKKAEFIKNGIDAQFKGINIKKMTPAQIQKVLPKDVLDGYNTLRDMIKTKQENNVKECFARGLQQYKSGTE